MTKFFAAVLRNLNAPLDIEELRVPKLEFGQVLVKISVSGLCGAQLLEIRGEKGNEKFLPHLLGHEGFGAVIDIGPGVTTVSVGQKVVMHWRKGAGIDADFPIYESASGKIGGGKVTTLSEYSVVSENRLTAVGDDLPGVVGALLGCGLSTALGVMNLEAKSKFGESVMIVGCGGLGLSLIRAARLASAGEIIGIDSVAEKRDLVLTAGATAFFSSVENSVLEQVKEIVSGSSIDLVVDTTGDGALVSELLTLLSDNGRLVLVGQIRPEAPICISSSNNFFGAEGKAIISTQGGGSRPPEDIQRYARMYSLGRLEVEDLVTDVYNLQEVNSAFDRLRTGRAGRVMIRMSND